MKKTLLSIVMLTLAITASSQSKTTEKTYKRDGKAFVQKADAQASVTDTATAYVWRDKQGNEYPIYLHRYTKGDKAGRYTAYVIRVSKKTGKQYKQYLTDGEQIANEILKETK